LKYSNLKSFGPHHGQPPDSEAVIRDLIEGGSKRDSL
jgi:hypothetical protein